MSIQKITTNEPVKIPAIAPYLVRRFQYSDNKTKGPNAAPNPAQALPTKFKIVSFGFYAMYIATIDTSKTDKRPTRTNSFS